MTFVILTGGIDLSVGSVMALCGVALGLTVRGGAPLFLHLAMAFPLGVLAALAVNTVQGTRAGRQDLARGRVRPGGAPEISRGLAQHRPRSTGNPTTAPREGRRRGLLLPLMVGVATTAAVGLALQR